ncbi:MAG: flagellar biosynthetic protein FliO [Ignavibacteriae bacterium]|nr:flagellar biosynthetic protein FliO [Ignavibacteriota bacterium]
MKAWDIIQIFIILGVMVAVMYGLLFLVKKYLYRFDNKESKNSKIKILSTQAILPKKFVSVIQFNNQTYLLGVSDQSVNLIDKIDQSFSEDLIKDETQKPKNNFLELLKTNMGIK